ncbi:hypothetical protein E2C01_071682 [Portunus trituberculatus]|uniref:Uncharacterized protein n=1 Tax=Portunus trituberculatus TaxID=210409 RepID=A0A5B7I4J8_PORTR|nr:hypothetical protein [Portunus trituberculatus]
MLVAFEGGSVERCLAVERSLEQTPQVTTSRAASSNEVGAPEGAEDKKDSSLDNIASTLSVKV